MIGKYARQERAIGLDEAIEKMTLMPARLLEGVSSGMKTKGRLQEGMDADVVVLDFDTIRDRATVEDPARYSDGIEYVIINGVIVRDKGKVFHKPAGRLIKSDRAR